jgi:hypothetical protein
MDHIFRGVVSMQPGHINDDGVYKKFGFEIESHDGRYYGTS